MHLKKDFPLLITAILFAGWLALLIPGLGNRLLEYDELWTLFFYAKKTVSYIFTELAVPNNHPLHSFLCGLFLQDKSDYRLTLTARIPAFFSGVLLLLIFSACFRRTVSCKPMLPAAFAFLAFSPLVLVYSSIARGYTLQSLFLLLFCICLFRKTEKHEFPRGAALLFCAAGTCLTITSGLLFIVSAGCSYLLTAEYGRGFFRRERCFLAAGLLFLIGAGLWYGFFYSEISAGQAFGVSFLQAPGIFLRDLATVLFQSGLYLLIPLSAVLLFCRRYRKYGIFTVATACLVFLFSMITNLGPVRVYLPLLPLLTLSAMAGLAVLLETYIHEKKIKIFILCCLTASAVLHGITARQNFYSPDWRGTLPLLRKASPEEYPCFTPTEAVRMKYLYPGIGKQNYAPVLQSIALYQTDSVITGEETNSGKQVAFDLSPYIADTEYLPGGITKETVKLRIIQGDELLSGNEILFCICRDSLVLPSVSGWYMLNNSLRTRPVNVYIRRTPDLPSADLADIMKQTGGRIMFCTPVKSR